MDEISTHFISLNQITKSHKFVEQDRPSWVDMKGTSKDISHLSFRTSNKIMAKLGGNDLFNKYMFLKIIQCTGLKWQCIYESRIYVPENACLVAHWV